MMDAMVFFAVAMLICSVQLAQLHGEITADRAQIVTDERYDPRALLDALLGTSIGQMLTIDADVALVVRPELRVADCLAAEALGLMRGHALSAFDEMNNKILAITSLASAPLSRPTIFVDKIGDEVSRMLTLGEDRAQAANLRAASSDLFVDGAERVVVTLVLEPALLSEPLRV